MKILIFDLDETLVSSFTGKLLISEAVLQILKELADSPDYILTIASFNDSAHEILEDLGIQHLFSHVSAGFKKPDQKIHSFPMSKIDNVQKILDCLKELPENRFVFFDKLITGETYGDDVVISTFNVEDFADANDIISFDLDIT